MSDFKLNENDNAFNNAYSENNSYAPQFNNYSDSMNASEPIRTTMTGLMTTNEVLTGSFLFMFIALLLTGITAVVVSSSEALMYSLFGSTFSLIAIFAIEIGLVFACQATIKKNNIVVSTVLFVLYSIVNGLTLSVVFLVYTQASVTRAFFSTAMVFAVMAIFGKLTSIDLTSLGGIFGVGLLATIVISTINLFIGSTMIDMGISVVTIVIFLGLTAYDVQKIEKLSRSRGDLNPMVISLYGAIELYLDFINLFLKILRLMGRRK